MALHDVNNELLISKIKLPGSEQIYQIHDASAIHEISDLGLASALRFMGTKDTEQEIFDITSASVGDVYLCTSNGAEYICIEAIAGTPNESSWEKLGDIHDAASSTHTHTATVTGTNASSTVTGSVAVPTVSSTQKYLSVESAAPSVESNKKAVLGASTAFTVTGGEASTTNIKATATGVAVAGDGTVSAITSLGTPTTDSALGVNATFAVTGGKVSTSKMVTTSISNPTVEAVSVPNVTGNTTVNASKVASEGTKTDGTAASWSANVSDGLLSFNWTANVPTEVTLPTFTDVTATNTTLGTNIAVSKVTTSDVVVATGSLADTGAGDSVATNVSAVSVAVNDAAAVSAITDLGTASTKEVLTGVKVTAQPTVSLATGAAAGAGVVSVATDISSISVKASGDNIEALTGVEVTAPAITLTNNTDNIQGSVPVVTGVTIGSANVDLVNGVAAGQVWTQTSGSTSTPQ